MENASVVAKHLLPTIQIKMLVALLIPKVILQLHLFMDYGRKKTEMLAFLSFLVAKLKSLKKDKMALLIPLVFSPLQMRPRIRHFNANFI